MELGAETYFARVIIPAWQDYLNAERELTDATINANAEEIEAAEYKALRYGGAAAFFLHHFSDIVFKERPPFLPAEITGLPLVRTWVGDMCFYRRDELKPVGDVELLGAVADSLKHSKLRNEARALVDRRDVLIVSRGYGKARFGEGKYGGVRQVWVETKDGDTRALTSVFQNVIDAWRARIGLELPALGEP